MFSQHVRRLNALLADTVIAGRWHAQNMNLETFLNDRSILDLLLVILTVVITIVTQRILRKRGLITYFVRHSQVGMSADDVIFGSVRVTWNGNEVPNLYSSILELRNESLKDYDNVTISVYTSDTILLSEKTQVVGTPHILEWSADFSKRLAVQPGAQPTPDQQELYGTHREYLLPTLNRGQAVRLIFLNVPRSKGQPSIWMDIQHHGIKVKFRVAHDEVLGTPGPAALLAGTALGVPLLAVVIASVNTVWVATALAFLYGLLIKVPGAYSIKLWRWIRELVGD